MAPSTRIGKAGGRWQVVKVGRQRSSPWPVGYGPRFLPGSREDGASKHDAPWAVTAASQRLQDREADLQISLLEDEVQVLSL